MSLPHFSRCFFARTAAATIPRNGRCFRPTLQILEDRLAPALLTVTNANDAGGGSLRAAILAANATAAADVINFAPGLANQTITMTTGQYTITKPLTIVGLGSSKLTLDTNNASRIFNVDDGAAAKIAVSISGLRLTRGNAFSGNGAGILNQEALTVVGCLFDHNFASFNLGSGGGIYNNGGTLALTNSTLSDNGAVLGGGIYSLGGTVTLTGSSLFANTGGVAGIYNSAGTLTLINSTLSANSGATAGIVNLGGTVNLIGSTLSANISVNNAGGIYTSGGTLIVTNSTLASNSTNASGGAIYVNSGTVTLTNSTLAGNTAPSDNGGGIYVNSGNVTLSNSTLSANIAAIAGGGIYINSGTVTLTQSTCSANSAGSTGGGLHNESGTLTLSDSFVSANSASVGGGIYGYTGTLTVTSSLFAGNSAIDHGGGIYANTGVQFWLTRSNLFGNSAGSSGGGIFSSATSTLADSTVSANSAFQGGGIYGENTLTLANVTVSANVAASEGGGIYYYDGPLTATNSTFSGNSASQNGGGLYKYSGRAFLTNCTIVGNDVTTGLGGGFYLGFDASLFNTIVAGNVKGSGASANDIEGDVTGGPSFADSTYNLIGDPNSAGGLTNAAGPRNIVGKDGGALVFPLAEILDPMLRNNGGPTLTHALIPGSIAIDSASNSSAATLLFDQRGPGFPRIVSGTGLSVGVANVVDIGAYEMPRPLFADNFDRANNASLGAPWVTRAGAIGIVGNRANGAFGSPLNIASVLGLTAADVDLSARVYVSFGSGTSADVGLLARYAGAGDRNYYLASLKRDNGAIVARLVRNVNGVVTELAAVENIIDDPVETGLLRFRVVGSTLQLFLNGTLLATAQDSTFKSGAIGMRTTSTSSMNDVQAWPVSTGVDNIDLFTRPDYTRLSDPWINTVGYFSTFGNKIQGDQALNIAVLKAVTLPDVDVQASVSITGLDHTAGLLARYQGSGNRNYYLAQLKRTSTGFSAQVVRNLDVLKLVNGKKRLVNVNTVLATVPIASTTGKANLRLLVTGTNLRFYVNSVPVANVFDTALANGSVGIRADQYSTLDDFHAAAVTTALTFIDHFDQPDTFGLNSHWTRRAGDFKVLNHTVVGTSAAPAVNLATLVGVTQANVALQANLTLATVGHEIGLLACYSGRADTNYYMARFVKTAGGFNLSVVKNVNGVVTTLKSVNTTTLGPIIFRLQGTSLKLFMAIGPANYVEELSVTDSSLTSGSVGIRSIGTGTIDDFVADAVPFVPFIDDFPSPTLSANWTTRAGAYTTAAASAPNKAKGTAAANFATLGRVNMSDVHVSAVVTVPAVAGQSATLVARYATNANMYSATFAHNGAEYVASITKTVAGVTTTLASVGVGTFTGTYAMHFYVIGGQLKLLLNASTVLTTYDFSLKSGSVGMRSSLDATLDNFILDQAS